MNKLWRLGTLAAVATVTGCWWGPVGPVLELRVIGEWTNVEHPPTPHAGCAVHFATSQTGQVRGLGVFSGTGATCLPAPPQQTQDPPHFFYDPAPPYFVAAFENEMVWTFAAGDLHLSPNEGVFVRSAATGQASVLGVLRVNGGTGKFEGASGELEVRSASEDGLELDFEGTIRFQR